MLCGTGLKTLDEVILEVEGELRSIGQAMPEMSLFRGKVRRRVMVRQCLR
jgi:hypothetical protein